MIKVIWECDRCGAKEELPQNYVSQKMFRVAFGILDRNAYGTQDPLLRSRIDQVWCEDCLQHFGLQPTPGKAAVPLPTLEDVLREMMREELADAR